MNQTIRQSRAIAIHAAQRRKRMNEVRQRRIDALRLKLTRRVFFDQAGWVFASAIVGASLALVVLRTIN